MNCSGSGRDAAWSVRFGSARGAVAAAAALVMLVGASCVRNPPPVVPEPTAPPPGAEEVAGGRPDRPAPRPNPRPAAPLPPVLPEEDEFTTRSLEEINRDSPLSPVFFAYDSSELDADARMVLQANADVLVQFPTWVVTIEGHCDERGTPEYNLGLGERRALAVREHLVRLGLPVSQLRTVSYGKEFPFAPGSDEVSWAANRRAHFVITAQ
ncbi:MAG: OmpA family protein [Acidobacteria bacterium]|nr:OmpA family protein [Acidobacteriota bacterium]